MITIEVYRVQTTKAIEYNIFVSMSEYCKKYAKVVKKGQLMPVDESTDIIYRYFFCASPAPSWVPLK